jgi:DNA polymerase-3 subunit beta
MQVVLPVKAVKLLLSMLPMMPKLLEVKVSKWRVYVEGENCLFIYQLLEGRFPNYRSVIPTNIHEVEVPVADLLEALRRVAVLGNQKQMTMTVTHDAIFLTSENEERSSSSKEELSVKSIFKLKIGLNINYFIALLSVIESKDCVLSFTDEAHAMLVKPVDENERLTLLQMPVKL